MDKHSHSSARTTTQFYKRRSFLKCCTVCTACATVLPMTVSRAWSIPVNAIDCGKPNIRLVFSHIPPDKPTWPNMGYDYEARKKELTDQLNKKCPNIEFHPTTVLKSEDAERLLKEDEGMDGYVVYLLGLWTGAARTIAGSGKPTVFVDDLYGGSGEFLIEYARAKRKGLKVAGVSSTRFSDVADTINCFDCLKKLQYSRIIDVTDRESLRGLPEAIEEVFGTSLVQVYSDEFNEAYKQADSEKGKEWAEKWIRNARHVVEPSREEIQKSGIIYVGMQNLMEKYKAQAIAVDCLGLYYGGKLPAYPCLGFFQLNNEGFVGACEADLQSTITMLTMSYLVNRPGFISDPVIDTSKNQVIYAHCVAPNKVYGPDGPTNTYDIRSHSEDRKGAAIRSLMPLGEITTSLKFDPKDKEMIIHQGTTVDNIDVDKACRTKLAAEVDDIHGLMTEWDEWGWHRVTFYGDHKHLLHSFCDLAGINVKTEG